MAELAWNSPEAFVLTSFRCPPFGRRKIEEAAVAASRIHPLVGDWIEAAPILVCALRDARYFQALFDHACQRGRLNDALRIVGIPTPMRKQTPAQVSDWARSTAWLEAFAQVGDSSLAQLLATVPVEQHGSWRRALDAIWRRKPRLRVRYEGQSEAFAKWAVSAAALHPWADIAAAMDLMEAQDCNLSWSMSRFEREHGLWVERMRHEYAAEAEARMALESEKDRQRAKVLEIDVAYDHRPLSGAIGGVQFKALTSPRKLMDEGYAMRHCVGAAQFRDALRAGRAFFYHLSARSVSSTLELQRRKGADHIGQHCGPCNQRPTRALEDAASALLALVRKAELEAKPPV